MEEKIEMQDKPILPTHSPQVGTRDGKPRTHPRAHTKAGVPALVFSRGKAPPPSETKPRRNTLLTQRGQTKKGKSKSVRPTRDKKKH